MWKKIKSIKPGTWIRTAALILALANQAFNELGWTPLQSIDEGTYNTLSLVLTAVVSVYAGWKNNSFTYAAIEADKRMEKLRDPWQ